MVNFPLLPEDLIVFITNTQFFLTNLMLVIELILNAMSNKAIN